MKKFCLFLGCVMMALCAVLFVPKAETSVNAEVLTNTNIYSLQNGIDYNLTQDLDCSIFTGDFVPVSMYNNTIDGRGYSIKNLTINAQADVEKVGFLSATNGAVIKNLKFENLNVIVSHESDLHISKVGLLIGEATNTKIENCAFVNCKITVASISSTYVGGLVGEIKDGSQVKNISVDSAIEVNQTGLSTTKQFYVGGFAGKISNVSVINTIASGEITVATQNEDACVGGFVGYVAGDYTKIKNNIYVGEITKGITTEEADYSFAGKFTGSFVGKLSCESDIPDMGSLNYYYTSDKNALFGNESEINEYNTKIAQAGSSSVLTPFPLDVLTAQKGINGIDTLRQEFYLDENKWDFTYPWDFTNVWSMQDKVNLPQVQNFQTFAYNVNHDKSFETFEKPVLESGNDIIIFDSQVSSSYKYGGSIYITASITLENNLDKFFDIVGLRHNNKTIFVNEQVMAQPREGEPTTPQEYKQGNITLRISNISDRNIYSYRIDNCNATNGGEYSVLLETIKYELTVKSENVDQGTVRRKSADASVKEAEIVDTVSYGQRIGYITTPTEDFAFDSWTLNPEDENAKLENQDEDVEFVFDEHVFMEGGIFYNFELGTDSLTLYSTFTRAVCQITFRFAINNKLVNENLTTVLINDKVITPTEDGVITYKAKMGEKYTLSVTLPPELQFTSWYESDGTSNVRDLASTMTMEITASQDSETMIVVANFAKEIEDSQSDSALLWIIIGCAGGLTVCVVVIILIVKKKKDNSYKSMY